MSQSPFFRSLPALGAVAAAATALLTLSAGNASAQALVGLTSAGQLTSFNAATPGTATTVAITGLAAGDRFVGIDLRPSNNTIYGLTTSNQIYTLNEVTGAATFVAALSVPLINASLGWGIDFNPMADFAGAASLRVVSSAGQNLAVNANTGVVGNTASNIGFGYTGAGYTNSSTSGAPASTSLYYINTDTNTLNFAATAFNAPAITLVGSLGVGIDPVNANGFEVLANGTAFAALNLSNSASLNTGIYSINLATGAATLTGNLNGTLSGLTISAVPEPGTYGLLAAGLGVVGFLSMRRRNSARSSSLPRA